MFQKNYCVIKSFIFLTIEANFYIYIVYVYGCWLIKNYIIIKKKDKYTNNINIKAKQKFVKKHVDITC